MGVFLPHFFSIYFVQHKSFIRPFNVVSFKPKFQVARHFTSYHHTLSVLCNLALEKVVTWRVARVDSTWHDAHVTTRTTRVYYVHTATH